MDYSSYDQMVRLAEDCGAKTLDVQYTDHVAMVLRMLDGTQEPLLAKLTELFRGKEDVEASEPVDAMF
ncbi:MAG: DUF1949 domain-containing protein [Slackia sp.]